MNIDCDAHFDPPEVFSDPEVTKYKSSHVLHMNGYKHSDAIVNQYLRQGQYLSIGNMPTFTDVYGNVHAFDITNFDIKLRLKGMKEAGFDKQCITTLYNRLSVTAKAEAAYSKSRNYYLMKYAQKYDWMIPIADIPHHDPDMAIEEAERAVRDLGYKAVYVEGSWLADFEGAQSLESIVWWPFFEAISKLDVPIFIHGRGRGRTVQYMDQAMAGYDRLKIFPPKLGGLFGFLLQAQVGLAGVIYPGLLDKYPNLIFLLAEVDAGWVPGYMSTLDGMYEAYRIYVDGAKERYFPFVTSQSSEPLKLRKKPSQYCVENFFYTLQYKEPLQSDVLLPILVEKCGLGKNLGIESDFPHNEGN
jgi:predicted TIM-barrel fold metal-dependent hydrolase